MLKTTLGPNSPMRLLVASYTSNGGCYLYLYQFCGIQALDPVSLVFFKAASL